MDTFLDQMLPELLNDEGGRATNEVWQKTFTTAYRFSKDTSRKDASISRGLVTAQKTD